MGYTPLVRWRNFTLENLKWVLNLYPDMQFNKSKQEVLNQIEENCKGYKKTIYQYCAQLGLESKEPIFKTQYYLYGFNDDNLNKYLDFWFKMYVCPNPYVSSKFDEVPISPFFSIGNEILASPDHKISYNDFCIRKFGDGKSNDIFRNALIAFGNPIELEGDILYVKEDNINELKRILDKVNKTLPMKNHKDPKEFFERFDYTKFIDFYDLKTIEDIGNPPKNNTTIATVFENWMRDQEKQDGSHRFTDHTINVYITTITKAAETFDSKSIFDITDITEFEKICNQIKSHPEYEKFNKNRGNGALSAGLRAYAEFLTTQDIGHLKTFSDNRFIISDDNNKSYTLDELAVKLKDMYDDPESSKTAGVQAFAIKYGDTIAENDYSIKEIINKSGLSESYTTVLSDAFTTYKTIKSNHFGLAFADNECLNEVETDSNIHDQPSKMSFIRVGAGVGKASEFESFINGNYAGIGWNEIGNLNEIIDKSENPKADIAELLGQIYYSDKTETGRKRVSAKKAGEMLAFFDAKAYENYFVAMKGRRVLAIGQITGDYYFDESKMFGHCRPVDWIKIFSDEQIYLPEDEGYLTTCCDIIKENNIEFLNSLINGNDMPEDEIFFDYEEFKTDKKKYKRNLILHGAPGTGKSHSIEKLRKDLIGDELNYTRVTFHPDYTYSGFVGTYKPVPLENGENSEITYEYVPGPFMKILTEALMHQDVPYLLIIEEINRANTAAVFGGVFQLLDRDNTGKSQYPVNVSRDMKSYLKRVTGINFDEIRIPSNMFIWATMNSADQGVYPMDTAFKRRWSFSYIGLNDSEDEMRKYDVILGEKAQQRVNWNKLRNALNDKLTLLGINEDKLLGPFFISEHDMSDEKGFSEVFKDKVISYLFEDAARGKRNKLFKTPVKRYSEICRDFDIRGTEIFDFEDVNTDFSPVSGLAGNE